MEKNKLIGPAGTDIIVRGVCNNSKIWLCADNSYDPLPPIHIYESILNVLKNKKNTKIILEYPEEIDVIPAHLREELFKKSGLAFLYCKLRENGTNFDIVRWNSRFLSRVARTVLITKLSILKDNFDTDLAEYLLNIFKKQFADYDKTRSYFEFYRSLFEDNMNAIERSFKIIEVGLMRYLRNHRKVAILEKKAAISEIITQCLYRSYENLCNIASMSVDIDLLCKVHAKDENVFAVLNIENVYRLSLRLKKPKLLHDSMEEKTYKNLVKVASCIPKTFGPEYENITLEAIKSLKKLIK